MKRTHGDSATNGSSSSSSSNNSSRDEKKCFGSVWWDDTAPQSNKRKQIKAEPVDGEQLLAKEMQQLSMHERETVFGDIHGVPDLPEEKADFVATKLDELDALLSSIRKKDGYDRAMFMTPRYVKDEAFRLMFLRADRFDVDKAARRVIHHFEEKYRLFGYLHMGQRIAYSDLPPLAQEAVQSGGMLMAKSDKIGRAVFFHAYKNRKEPDAMTHLQALWYAFMTGVQDNVETQKKGVVLVPYTLGCTPSHVMSMTAMTRQQDFEKVLPFRVAAIHVCFGMSALKPIIGMFMAAHPQPNRLRVKIHFGSDIECQYALNSFGIPCDIMPFDTNGEYDFAMLKQWLSSVRDQEDQRQLAQEEQEKSEGVFEHPQMEDVVLGRGSPYQKFPGNKALVTILQANKQAYDATKSRAEKTNITVKIVNQVKKEGGRFVKRHESGDGWIVVSDEVAREKVAMGMRNLTRRQK